MRDLEKLKELPLSSTSEALPVLERVGDTGWDVLGAGPKANPRLPVDEKR